MFYKIRICEKDEWKTTFRTRFNLYKWMITPFELSGAPSTFQRYINWTLKDYLDDFCSVYLDDILIFSKGSLRQHREHVCKVLDKLKKVGFYLNINKYKFEIISIKYLDFIIKTEKGIYMDLNKIKMIRE